MRMVSFALALTIATATAIAAPPSLTPEGLGPVRIGMTLKQAEAALGHKLTLDGTDDPAGCHYASGNNVSYMFEGRHLVRIDIEAPGGTATATGIRLGSTETAVKKAYPHVVIEPHPYTAPQGHYLRVDTVPKKAGFIFETDGKRVTSLRAGIYPALDYSEGCS